jgi:hypothetical protein
MHFLAGTQDAKMGFSRAKFTGSTLVFSTCRPTSLAPAAPPKGALI